MRKIQDSAATPYRYHVERRDWFGSSEQVGPEFSSKAEASRWARELQRFSISCDDPDDKVTHVVITSVVITSEA